MKFLVVSLFAVALVGCDQLLHGQQQSVKLLKNNMYSTSCGGAVETWGNCNNKAMITCPSGYVVIKKNENGTGTLREIIFECKK